MKYNLINKITGEETICEKITIDGFDYYVTNQEIEDNTPVLGKFGTFMKDCPKLWRRSGDWKVVITTNNPNIDIPKVVDEVEIPDYAPHFKELWLEGYQKSQETYPFSEDDMIEFAEWKDRNMQELNYHRLYTTKELLQVWKCQKIKTIYYN